jgi:hypothetical protein
MSPDATFLVIQLLPLPIWFVWIVLPGGRLAHHLTRATWPWVALALVYVACFATALATGGRIGPEAFSSLSGMMRLFDPPWGALTAWVHYLCFDTFVARWMVRETPNAVYKLSPILVATMMFGPLGLLAFFAVRPRLQGARTPAPA